MSSRLFVHSQRIPLFLSSNKICFCSSQLKGHSHWQNVAKTKTTKDQEKAKNINIFAKKIVNAVKEGFDPAINKKLAKVMEVNKYFRNSFKSFFKEYKKESLPMETFNKILERQKVIFNILLKTQIV